MEWMFFGCKSLISLPDISNWDISNVININFMFSGCSSLQMLPDISKCNKKYYKYERFIFRMFIIIIITRYLKMGYFKC